MARADVHQTPLTSAASLEHQHFVTIGFLALPEIACCTREQGAAVYMFAVWWWLVYVVGLELKVLVFFVSEPYHQCR
jgi:hypothetical protein